MLGGEGVSVDIRASTSDTDRCGRGIQSGSNLLLQGRSIVPI